MYQKKNELRPLKVISLFSGYGAQELALKRLNLKYECVSYCDIDEKADEIFKLLHYPTFVNLGDISQLDENNIPKCDLLTISSPCQDISISGQNKGIEDGTRSGLLLETERIIKQLKPKYILFENVKNLVSKRHISSFNSYITFLKSLGYGCYWRVLNAADFGIPQNRERVYMMCVLNESDDFVKTKMLSVDTMKIPEISLRSILDNDYDNSLIVDCPFEHNSTNGRCKIVAMRSDTNFEQSRRIYSINGISPCLMTSNYIQILTDDGLVRKLSVRENYKLMGLNDEEITRIMLSSVADTSHSKLAGNSIVVNMLEAIFKEFFEDYIQIPKPVTNYFWADLKICA